MSRKLGTYQNAGGGFTIYWEQEENFLQTAYMADEIMAPGNTCQCFHGQQAEAEHNDEEQRIKAELLR